MLNTITEIKKLTSYELITLWIDRAYKLDISSNAIQVMTVLLRFYNNNKKYIFPHQGTISERTKLSISTVKRALNELLKANLILKHRTQRGNIYAFTGALFELLNSSQKAIPTGQNELCMNKQINKPSNKTTTSEVVSFSDKKEDILLKDFVIKYKKPKNVQSYIYWLNKNENSEIKKSMLDEMYLLQEKEIKKQRLIQEQQRQIELERQEREKQANKPLQEIYSREKAIKFITSINLNGRRKTKNHIALDLIKIYNLTFDEIKQ